MPIYEYQGQRYQLPDGLTNEQAKEKILDYIASQQNAAPRTTVQPEEEEDFLEGIGEGIVGGVIEMGSGIAETVALVPDYFGGTEYARQISQARQDLKDTLGINPTSTAGKITEALVQFAIPGLGAAGAIGKVSKLRNLGKTTTRAAQIGGAGVADAIVASDGTTTVGDFFEGGPTMTSKDIGLSGKAEAERRIANKFKVGLEAAGATAAIEPALRAMGYSAKAGVSGVRALADVTRVAPALSKTGEILSRPIQKTIEQDNLTGRVFDRSLGVFRSRGMLPQNVFEKRSNLTSRVEAELSKSGRVLRKLQTNLNKIFDADNPSFRNIMINGSSTTRAESMNLLYSFLTRDPDYIAAATREAQRLGIRQFDPASTDDLAQFLPDFMRDAAITMRGQIDLVSQEIAESPFVTSGLFPDIREIINDELGTYMRRKYAAFENPNWFNTEEFQQAYENAKQFYIDNPDIAESLYTRFVGPIPDTGITTGIGINRRTDRVAVEDLLDNFVSRYKAPRSATAMDGTNTRIVRDRLRTSLFTRRKMTDPILRSVLGEIKDPLETYVSTISDLAEFRVVDDFYNYLDQNILDQGDLLITPQTYEALPDVLPNGLLKRDVYSKLGDEPLPPAPGQTVGDLKADIQFGSIQGNYAKRSLFNELTRTTQVAGVDLDNFILRATYGNFLKAKGATQFAKTVLSPITQVRNVTSAALFAAAQGNIGRGAKLGESVNMVFDNIYKGEIPKLMRTLGITADEARATYFRKLQEVGVVGTQAQIREIDKLLEEGLGGSLKSSIDDLGVDVGSNKGVFRRTLGRSKLGQFLDSAIIERGKGLTTRARDYYQGGDDIWKIYNFEFEKSKLVSALGSEDAAEAYARSVGFDTIDEYAADIVKNVVPNYLRVPEAVKSWRKLPFGNFIAFPAEIIRTSSNTLKYAIRELQSENRAVRDIGMRRLVGFTLTAGVAGPALQQLGMYATGVAQDQMEALQRRVAPWSRASTLIPTSVEVKKGPDGEQKPYVTGYIDYSFFNPYDYFNRPARAIMEAAAKNELRGLDGEGLYRDAAVGVIKEMFKPFSDLSIIAEKILDVERGETKTGQKVYNKPQGEFRGDDGTEIAVKSFFHIADAFNPGAIEQFVGRVDVQPETGEVGYIPSRIVTAMTAPHGRDARGNVRNVEEELLSFFTGLREADIKPENVVKYGAYQYGDVVRGISADFNSTLRVETQMDPMNVIEAYARANEKLFREENKIFGLVKDMRTLGMPDREIRKALKKANVGNVNRIMRGLFTPKQISDNIKKVARKNVQEFGGTFPLKELNDIRRILNRRPLTGTIELDVSGMKKRFDVSQATIQPQVSAPTPTDVAPAPAAPVEMGAAPILPSAAAPAPIPQGPLTTDLGSLVKDPRTRELVERQRGLG